MFSERSAVGPFACFAVSIFSGLGALAAPPGRETAASLARKAADAIGALTQRVERLELRIAALETRPEDETPSPRPMAECRAVAAPVEVRGEHLLSDDLAFAGTALHVVGDVTIRLNGHTVYYGTSGADEARGVLSDTYDVKRVSVVGPGWIVHGGKFSGAAADKHGGEFSGAAADKHGGEVSGAAAGEHSGAWAACHAIDVPRGADGIAVDIRDVELRAAGRDTSCVRVPYGSVKMRGVTAICEQTATNDRHARPANVWCPSASVDIEGCVLIGGNSGVVSAHRHPVYGGLTQVRRSFVSVSQFATNGYGLSQGLLEDCVLAPLESGRGIILESCGCQVRRCVVLALDRPNEEFGDPRSLDGPGVRIRHYGPGRAENHAYGNLVEECTVMSVGGGALAGDRSGEQSGALIGAGAENHAAGGWCNATALFLSDRPDSSAGKPDWTLQKNTVRRSTFIGIWAGGGEGLRARAVSLESQGRAEEPSRDVIEENTFWSNQYLLSTSGSDNESGCWQAAPLSRNRWGWLDGARAHAMWFSAARAKLAEIGLADEPAVRARMEAVERALTPLADAKLAESRATWLSGVYGPSERCVVLGLETAEGSLEPAGWEPENVSGSERQELRELFLGSAEEVEWRLGNSAEAWGTITKRAYRVAR